MQRAASNGLQWSNNDRQSRSVLAAFCRIYRIVCSCRHAYRYVSFEEKSALPGGFVKYYPSVKQPWIDPRETVFRCRREFSGITKSFFRALRETRFPREFVYRGKITARDVAEMIREICRTSFCSHIRHASFLQLSFPRDARYSVLYAKSMGERSYDR